MIRPLLVTLLLAAGAAEAQSAPPGPPPPPREGTPSPEALATVPDLDAAKQTEVRHILLQRRDAHDALRAKEEAERDAARARYRAEHERIDDDSSAKLRKLLGEDGYRALAQWLVAPHGMGPGGMGPDRPRGPRPGARPNDPAAAHPSGPDPDGPESQPRVR
ncbi:MAG TPA: hypothetical protein VHE32_13935 [Rhodanobacteraceae bacterium]|nr:hypothetical protein [Rhodanobacteraceae bacterium]